MGILSSLARRGGQAAAPRVGKIAPGRTERFLDAVLTRAISGIGPLRGAVAAGDQALAKADGDVDQAVEALISSHVRMAGAQGFVTNVGGLVTLAASIPANVTGLVMVQLRLHAAIAHLHGYDLGDRGVRAALLVTLLGHDRTEKLVRNKDLSGNAAWLAAGGAESPAAAQRVTEQVAATLVGLLGGKQAAITVGKRVPLLGGVIGGAFDARATSKLGHDAARSLPKR